MKARGFHQEVEMFLLRLHFQWWSEDGPVKLKVHTVQSDSV